MISGFLDFLTPTQWGDAVAITIISAFLYRLGIGIKRGLDRRLKAWEDNLMRGIPLLGDELTAIRKLLEAGQGRMERHEAKADGHELRIVTSEERIGIMQGEVKVLTIEQKATRVKVHDIEIREMAAKVKLDAAATQPKNRSK